MPILPLCPTGAAEHCAPAWSPLYHQDRLPNGDAVRSQPVSVNVTPSASAVDQSSVGAPTEKATLAILSASAQPAAR